MKDRITQPEIPVSTRGSTLRLKIGQSWQCDCGEVHELGGAYLAAHWGEMLEHTCSKCKVGRTVRRGRLTDLRSGP